MSQDDLSRPVNELIAAFDEQERTLQDAIRKASARLSQVRAARLALLALESEDPLPFDGKLADAIRVVLKAKQRSLIPIQVRDEAKALGYDFSAHTNQMAAVHGVLKRMVESGEVSTKEWAKQPSVTRYFWSDWDLIAKPTRDALDEQVQQMSGGRFTVKGGIEITDEKPKPTVIIDTRTDALEALASKHKKKG